MTPQRREEFQLEVLAALSDPRDLMSEGRPHKRAKSRALDMLGLHFKTLGRHVYLAEEMAVMYPGEEAFSPDVLAVLDVPQPDDDPRLAWVVADERRGLDFVLEVLHRGDRRKDLVFNVERYARLGIPEYFVYDRAQERIVGYRLPVTGERRYQRVVPQAGRYTSAVLGLDLMVQGGALRFFYGIGELISSEDLIGRLNGMVESLEAKADAAEAKADAAEARADAAEAKAGTAEAKADVAVAALREAVLTLLSVRGVECGERDRARVLSCDDPTSLRRWLTRAATAASASEALSADADTE